MATKIEQLREHVRVLLAEHDAAGALPTSARFLCYELHQRGWGYRIEHRVRSTSRRRPEKYVSEVLTEFRRGGVIPWHWIVDETRELHDLRGASSVVAGTLDMLAGARLDPWETVPPMLLTESRSLAGVLRPIADRYCVPIASTNGQAGGFLRTEIAPLVDAEQTVLYFGDHNRAGFDIEVNTRRVLEDDAGPLEWVRVALTDEQLDEYGPPSRETVDGRDGRAGETFEAESIGQTALVAVLTGVLDDLLPVALDDVLAQEADERDAVRAVLVRETRRRRRRRRS